MNLLGDFDASAATLIFDKDISHMSKPEIKGRGFIKSGKDIHEFQSYWTEKEKDFIPRKVEKIHLEDEDAQSLDDIPVEEEQEPIMSEQEENVHFDSLEKNFAEMLENEIAGDITDEQSDFSELGSFEQQKIRPETLESPQMQESGMRIKINQSGSGMNIVGDKNGGNRKTIKINK